MISVEHVRLMARYNTWQNRSLYTAAGTLDDERRKADRGAFFKSIHGTLCHLYFGDQVWLARFTGGERPPGSIKESPGLFPDWADLSRRRTALDLTIESWAQALDPAWLDGDLTWVSGISGREVTKARWLLVTHFFNHQTHHRGQVHALLTACGAKPEDTDLPFMPA